MNDGTDPGPVPGEKKTRRPALQLSDKAVSTIRIAAEYTGLSQEVVKTEIATRTMRAGAHSLDALVGMICLDLAEEADRKRKETRESLFPIPRPVPAVEEEAP